MSNVIDEAEVELFTVSVVPRNHRWLLLAKVAEAGTISPPV